MDSEIGRFDEHYAYQAYLFEKKEWPSFKYDKQNEDFIVHQPFLIMELYRLVPYLKDGKTFFHPLNMPHIKIGRIEIVGMLTAILSSGGYSEYQVEDGTGTLIIKTKPTNVLKDAGDEQISRMASLHKHRYTVFESDSAIPGHSRSSKEKRLRAKKQKVLKYVHAKGYLVLDFNCRDAPRNDFTVEDLSLATPKLLATSMHYINEKQYNRTLQTWINTVVAGRYLSPTSPTREHFPKTIDDDESTTKQSMTTVDDHKVSAAKHSPKTEDDYNELVLPSELLE